MSEGTIKEKARQIKYGTLLRQRNLNMSFDDCVVIILRHILLVLSLALIADFLKRKRGNSQKLGRWEEI